MKSTHSCLKYTNANIPWIGGFVFLLTLIVATYYSPKSEVVEQIQPSYLTGIYTLPSHLNIELDHAEIIYIDADNDITYYRLLADVPVKKGDTVTLTDGTEMSIIDWDVRGFYLEINYTETFAGLSGSPVWFNDEIIGHVSTLMTGSRLYCVWDIMH